MAKRKQTAGQLDLEDLMLEIENTDTFILLTINEGGVSVWSTLARWGDAVMYLQCAAEAVRVSEE